MKVAMIGSGSWGTALALVLNENKHEVVCWTKDDKVVETVRESGENSRYLPGIKIPASISFTSNLEESMRGADMVINAVPSQVSRDVISKIPEKYFTDKQIWVTVSKGIENNTYKRVSEVIAEAGGIDPRRVVALSGPSHAEEVARRIPTAIVSASIELDSARKVQDAFMTPYFRVYANDDVTGVELGGALKNIIALAAGICDGAGFGDNTKAALITRGLVEMNRLGKKMGARSDTFAGLSGMGDLIVTCMSQHSRNRYVGEQIGKGRSLQEILDEMVMVAEGVKTTLSAYELSQKYKVEMPITEQIYLTLFENKPPHDAMVDLMTRESKVEDWGKSQ
ncbi:MAG TPA: NAD(P)H-dependent glycerol-3-phosphate dehydrogenase [Caldithrix abyssi]|uniref:Glycerol-3-phosphate dehydrogenase [NAD(P)+] n=1 Tax=Caldithrix abyssi TaxID=187145 RepID=A0A7V1PVW9_CALAY|nr:NAD(P)H-dependent glycerol-3-phosphate dehydrogenase [Caldithrix abyssi]